MSIEEREGILDHCSEKGIILSGARLSYSKWFEGEQPSEDMLGSKIRVIVDAGSKCTFLKRIVHVGQKSYNWKPPESSNRGFSGGGGGRRFSPEELDLKRDEGIRIARSVAIDRAITMAKEGIEIEKIADLASSLEAYILKGELPHAAKAALQEVPAEHSTDLPPSANPVKVAPEESPKAAPAKKESSPSAPAKPKRLASRSVNLLFNEARQGGLVADWNDYLALIQNVLKVAIKSPYHLGVQDFTRVESFVKSKLGRQTAA
ncbi:MAG TPA: hypothetical protein VMU54_14615 [Planctomycetota bacterium]|nr:hypothetical protein [Planctomycetota bacterium]